MEPHEIYATSRRRLIELAPTLLPDQLDAPLAATPPWKVADAYRHLTGVCTNILDGVMQGAGSPSWTAAQVECRAGDSVADVCTEWSERGPALEAQVATAGAAMSFVAFDAWTHEQDVRAAIGLGGLRDDVADALALLATSSLTPRYSGKGAPTVHIDFGDAAATLGEGDPVLRLSTSQYELLRMIFGRRSKAQVEAAGWSGEGDRDAAVDALHIFDFPRQDITD